GTVSDPSSAVVSGAMVTAVQTGTGFSRAAFSDARGNYVFDQLAPGDYRLTAEKAGFNRYQANRVVLELNQKARYDIQLTLGVGHVDITVGAAVSPVNTEDASLGYRMDNLKIASLPLATRTVISLVTLGPGAIP